MQPEETKTIEQIPQPKVKKIPRQRHFLATFFISFMWGTFGIDRFYMGYVGTGIIKLLTFGGFGFWTLIDLALIMTGAMKDKQGRDMLQIAEYKKFAGKVVLWFAIILGAGVLLSGISLILGVYQLFILFQDGGIQGIPGIGEGLNSLTGGSDAGQIQDLLKQ